MTDDKDLFRSQFSDIEPIKKTDRVVLHKSSDITNKDYARRVAVNGPEEQGSESFETVSDDYVDMVKPGDLLAFKRSGVQDGVFKKFRLGKYPIEGRLDLHRKTVAEARIEVFQFVREALSYDFRMLIILHGKGERNIDRQAVLKSYVAKWLKEIPDVMAYHSAIQQHGGMGAVYVLLRKSEKAKQQTREKLGRR